MYEVNPEEPWGPHWGKVCPPGLNPVTQRKVSTPKFGKAFITNLLDAHYVNLTPDYDFFKKALLNIAKGESGYCLGRPANNYNSLPYEKRLVFDKEGKPIKFIPKITAIHVFSWNEVCFGEEYKKLPKKLHELLPDEEVLLPAKVYARLWNDLEASGLAPKQRAVGLRVWHWKPGVYKRFKNKLHEGFDQAYLTVEEERRRIIDSHLANF